METDLRAASTIVDAQSAVSWGAIAAGAVGAVLYKFEPGLRVGRLSREERMRKNLTYEDALAVAQLPAVELSVPLLNITNDYWGNKISVKGGGKESSAVQLQGTLPTSTSRRTSGCSRTDASLRATRTTTTRRSASWVRRWPTTIFNMDPPSAGQFKSAVKSSVWWAFSRSGNSSLAVVMEATTRTTLS